MEVKELFDIKKIIAINSKLGKKAFLHEFFLDTRYTDTFKISTKVNGVNKAIAVRPSTFSADPILREFGKIAVYEDEKLTFKEAHKMTKDDLLQLTYLMKTTDPALASVFVEQRMRQIAEEDGFLDAVRIRAEFMFVQLITVAKMGVANKDGVTQEVDYMHPTENKVLNLGTTAWNTITGKPITDLMKWKKLNKVNARYAIMTEKTFQDAIKTDEVKKFMFEEYKVTIASDEEMMTAIERKTGVKVIIYEYQAHIKDNGPLKVIFPDDVVSMLPNKLGYTSYGPVTKDIYLGSVGKNLETDNYGIIPKTGNSSSHGATLSLQEVQQNGAIVDLHFEIESTMAPDEVDMSNLIIAKVS